MSVRLLSVKFFVVFLVFGFLVSCQNEKKLTELEQIVAKNKIEKEKLERNKSVVRRAHDEVWNKGNMEVINELYSPDYIAHWVTGGDTGLDEFKKMVVEARTTFPDLKEEIIHIVAEGDLVVTHFISSGTHSGNLGSIPPTGKKGSRPEIAVHRIENGKIVEQWTVADLLSLLNQLGIKL